MRLVILTHPVFFHSNSMERFARVIAEGMRERGHAVEVWTANPHFYNFPAPKAAKKWLGYLDQYLIFPFTLRKISRRAGNNALFVFTDETLGPWVPLVAGRPHVIHNHGFFALRSSRGEFPDHKVAWSGRIYQRYIHRGFSKGSNFISVSATCEADLLRYLVQPPQSSRVVHNGLNYPFAPMPVERARQTMLTAGVTPPAGGYLLHVGGNQYYKNRAGVLRIYEAYSRSTADPLPLLMIGPAPTRDLAELTRRLPRSAEVRFLPGLGDEVVHAAYAIASALIFPSIWEGFGWPIVEAMACGCLVLTTDRAPMNVIGAGVAVLVPPMPAGASCGAWADAAAATLVKLLQTSQSDKSEIRQKGLRAAERFSARSALDAYEAIYRGIAV